ncbi:PREDICTED: vanin-like protein 1 [Eufriesea mexicana]|uniref:vanin-like protein 1 n=1 Tax=Eufriesea mexicana TaxID=516756 RepID=UPI00083C3E6F|nr:PREDICTED: vanin-like protein 1 [Eufriesea mexicana]XP_017764854.1 PREDICTED: vanin-like protein 1 [Eufriesea mexicana]XP_017764855.1 PREDICTED: vanin-like protein 1 [Eufriesea mexicana]
MRGRLSGLGLLLVLVRLSYQMTYKQDSSNYYTAAVVEYSPIYIRNNGLLTLKKNTDVYIEYIKEASEQNADIIVFPEDGLTSIHLPASWPQLDSWTTAIPSALDEYVPCTENHINVGETLRRLSCAAKRNRIYVVVNIAEKRFCECNDECPSNRKVCNYYNTNVVFDRSGKIIARYRKTHLFDEPGFETTVTPEIVTFDTDFGVRFGTFICFDILFSVPPLNLTRMLGISNIVYNTAWFSEVPFLTAVQTQYGWSYAEDVNLLVAGYHEPLSGSIGSGIYLGRNGIANATMSRDPKHRILISQVPKIRTKETKVEQLSTKEGERNQETENDAGHHDVYGYYSKSLKGNIPDGIKLLLDNLISFTSVPLNGSMSESICHGDFCCDFEIATDISNLSSTHYRAVVYNGLRRYGQVVLAYVNVCGVIQCSNDTIQSCGSVSQSNTTFSTLSVTATFNDYPKLLVMPSILNSSLLPFQHWTYVEHTCENQTNLTIVLNEVTKDLVTFGIYARNFYRDKQN